MGLRAPVIDRGRSAMPPLVLSRYEGADRLGEFIDENGGVPGCGYESGIKKELGAGVGI
jgi:hypothetical protein